MKDKIRAILNAHGLNWSADNAAIEIWNAAVEECANNATYCHVEGSIDRDSILSLKIEDDEK